MSRLTLEDTNRYAAPTETKDLVNVLMSIRDTKLALFFLELEPNLVKISLRSDGSVDVNELSAKFGGGGHVRAAGCKYRAALAETIDVFRAAGIEALAGAGQEAADGR